MKLESEIERANDFRARAGVLVSGEYSDDPKVLLLIAYTDLVIDHHAAIMALLSQKHYGSAFALVRAQFETFMRANWVIGCASDKEAAKITVKEFEFPSMGDIVSACDKAFGTDQFFQSIKKQGWSAMNSYTHSGIRQLTRRFNNGKVEPNYSEAEIEEVINATTTTVLLQGKLFCGIVGKHREAEQMEALVTEFVPDSNDKDNRK